MEFTLDLVTITALLGAMALLALAPSMSVFAVAANAASGGFVPGAVTALGIVMGDLAFILFAIFGLTLLAENFGDLIFLFTVRGRTLPDLARHLPLEIKKKENEAGCHDATITDELFHDRVSHHHQ